MTTNKVQGTVADEDGNDEELHHRPITIELIRKRSEHNSSLISNLEEIALHQEELTSIGTTMGKVCGKTLRILLLQNNVISKLPTSEMKYFKVLEYLNLALNNLTVVTGLDGDVNEHLTKLDLTLNFIDYQTLEQSMDCLATLRNLKELFMMGNPCCLSDSHDSNTDKDGDTNTNTTKRKPWANFRMYVISKLAILEFLDGKQILRSERIKAMQMKSKLEQELVLLIAQCKMEQCKKEEEDDQKGKRLREVEKVQEDDSEERTTHCPEDRIKMSNEMATQKATKEKNERANQPKLKSEKEYKKDQSKAVEKAREREERGDIKQCNEGKWDFKFEEENYPGNLTLDISIQKHLSSSLIHVNVHPTYISVVIKSKVLRLVLPIEVKADESSAKRSLTTGHLLIIMPKFNLNNNAFLTKQQPKEDTAKRDNISMKEKKSGRCRGLQHELLDAHKNLKGPVQIRNIVSVHNGGIQTKETDDSNINLGLVESSSKKIIRKSVYDENRNIDDDPPPMI